MASTDQNGQQSGQPATSANDQRSENLLPADAGTGDAGTSDANTNAAGSGANAGDGRFEVAEEVNADQQSDATRRVGKGPQGNAADALAASLTDDAASPVPGSSDGSNPAAGDPGAGDKKAGS